MQTARDDVQAGRRIWYVDEIVSIRVRVRVVFLSHITSPTALIFPIKEICRRARDAGLLSIIDGAHALGQIPLDLEDVGADFYAANAHKWLCAPKGAAFLYARREAQHLVEPLVVSWGYEADKPSASRFIDEQEWTGTRDIAAYLGVPEAIRFCEEHHWDTVRLRCHEIAQYARERIHDLVGATGLAPLPHLCPDSTEWYMQMVTLPLPPCDAGAFGRTPLQARLYDEYHIEVPIVVWHNQPFVRVSIQAYNSREDVERLVEALQKLL